MPADALQAAAAVEAAGALADEPAGVDAVELVVDEAFDIPCQPLCLLPLLLLYVGL